MIGTCRCGSPFLRLFDDLGCVGCGRQCCWGCAVVIEAVAYCVRCAEVLTKSRRPPRKAQSVLRGVNRTSVYMPFILTIGGGWSVDMFSSRRAKVTFVRQAQGTTKDFQCMTTSATL